MNSSVRLCKFYNIWQSITQNPLILEWITGYRLPFCSKPTQRNLPRNLIKHNCATDIRKVIADLLAAGAISRTCSQTGQFISNFFIVKKSNGSLRFILNLKLLNTFLIEPPHFKLEDYRSVKDLIHKNSYLCKIDLQNAYYSVNINSIDRKYLKFEYEGNLYCFNCLPFGLSTAPFLFTKLLKPALTYLRNSGVVCVAYLDDILIIASSYNEAKKDCNKTVVLLTSLGFTINMEKSILSPTQECRFLGFNFNTTNMRMSLPLDKKEKIVSLCNQFLYQISCSIRNLAAFIGVLVAACPATQYGWAHVKALERLKYLALAENNNKYNKKINLPASIKDDIIWWLKIYHDPGINIIELNYQFEIFSDSSKDGWGAVCNSIRTRGYWGIKEKSLHINILELKAAYNAIKSFTKDLYNINLLIRVDNTTALAYINKMGGIRYKKLNKVAQKIWKYCEQQNIKIFASYINTKQNTVADSESRNNHYETEYELSQECFEKIGQVFKFPEIDLFASKLNTKCKIYISWKPDPDCTTVDAFLVSWEHLDFYAFPPFSIINKTIKKIIDDKATGILVVPKWPSQPWYPLFKKLLTCKPICFGPKKNLLMSPFRKPHPMYRTLTLVAGKLSGHLF